MPTNFLTADEVRVMLEWCDRAWGNAPIRARLPPLDNSPRASGDRHK